jgi:hypothetical protein
MGMAVWQTQKCMAETGYGQGFHHFIFGISKVNPTPDEIGAFLFFTIK